jgi:hypothetical protein
MITTTNKEERATLYHYDANSGIYTGSSLAFATGSQHIDDATTKYFYEETETSTFEKPPKAKEGHNIHYNFEKKEWEYRAIPEPTDDEKRQKRIWELEMYLSETIQEVLEALEKGENVKEELRVKRQEAREEIRMLKREMEDKSKD